MFADQLIRLAKQDMNILFHVHDEFIIETKEEEANQTLEKVIQVMSEAPKWISDIPLSADGKVVSRYEK